MSTMTAWEKALNFTLAYEGGFAENPHDRGGITFMGIASKFHPNWSGWSIVNAMRGKSDFPNSANNDKNLKILVTEFYKTHFWDALRCDELPEKMAICVFDMGVNSGVKTAIMKMQMALDIKTDGIIGPQTITAAHASGHRGIVEFLTQRMLFYAAIISAKPDQSVWAHNWFKRVIKLSDVVFGVQQ